MSRKILSALVAGAMTATVIATTVTPAAAEPAFVPDADDIVGVGSDTSMFVMQDLADIYNAASPAPTQRLVSFDALWGDMSTQIVLRQGLDPVTRPNGSTNGKATLRPATNNPAVDYARSSAALSQAEVNDGLWAFPFSVDGMKLAVSSTGTNAPSSLSAADMVAIYKGEKTNWNQFPGGKDGVIKPIVPQVGSGTYAFFVSQLTAANGGNAVTFPASAVFEQEHDPAPLAGQPNAVSPFSTGRARPHADQIALLDGWNPRRALYNVVRQSDLNDATLLGLFGTDGFLCSPAAREAIEANGLDQLATPENGGVCGEPTQAATSNFTVSEEEAAETSTALVASSPAPRSVTLRATVTAGTAAAPGTVEFREGETVRGAATLTQGVATLKLSNVSAGKHTYVASYTPADPATHVASQSAPVTVTVDAPVVVRATALKVSVAKLVAGKPGKATVVVSAKGTSVKPSGRVNALLGKKRLGTAKLKGGRATVKLAKMKAGKRKLRFVYTGSPTAKASSRTVKVTVRKR